MLFTNRSYKKEFLDAENIPQQDLFRNLFELDIINNLLGGHSVTIKGLKKLFLKKEVSYTIVDIGSGGGDTLKAIAKWGRSKGYSFKLIGVDLKKDCIEYATKACKAYPEISFVLDDYRNLTYKNMEIDIINTSLFCHHLNNDEIAILFSWAAKNAKVGFVLNDLHRHWLAYHSISFLTALFSKSYLVKNDAKLSVIRGFGKAELAKLLPDNIKYSLNWVWAFRWLLVITK